MLPEDRYARAHCRSICSEMHSGFSTMRAALPMNLKAHFPKYKIWTRARADIDRILEIWNDRLSKYGGPYLFGANLTVADAMYAPVVTRIQTYDVEVDAVSAAYCQRILACPECRNGLPPPNSSPTKFQYWRPSFKASGLVSAKYQGCLPSQRQPIHR